jgi:hypothetical protein
VVEVGALGLDVGAHIVEKFLDFVCGKNHDVHFRGAKQLLFKHGAVEALRTLDALQLSVALGLKRAELVTVFVAADQKLCRVATLEGFAVTNPEQPASIVI